MHAAECAVHHLLVLRPLVLVRLAFGWTRFTSFDPLELAPLAIGAVLGVGLLRAAPEWIRELVLVGVVPCALTISISYFRLAT